MMKKNMVSRTVLTAVIALSGVSGADAEVLSPTGFARNLNSGFEYLSAGIRRAQERYKLHWNGSEYVCVNGEGKVGLNKIETRDLLKTKNGECGDLEGQPLRYVDLMGANLDGARLGRSDLSGANLRGASLNGADLSKTILSLANLDGAQMIAVYAVDANLSMAVLNDAKLTKAHLTNADLSAAALVAAELSGADLRNATLDGAHLQRSTYDSQTKLPFSLQEADARGMFKIHR
jgi:hypothetical protein